MERNNDYCSVDSPAICQNQSKLMQAEEESKEKVMQESMIISESMRDNNFIENMPSLKDCAKMTDKKVFKKLS